MATTDKFLAHSADHQHLPVRAKIRIRRYFWSNVRILGDPLEYTALGSELFIGFLIVIAVLVPVGSVYGTFDTLLGTEETVVRWVLKSPTLSSC